MGTDVPILKKISSSHRNQIAFITLNNYNSKTFSGHSAFPFRVNNADIKTFFPFYFLKNRKEIFIEPTKIPSLDFVVLNFSTFEKKLLLSTGCIIRSRLQQYLDFLKAFVKAFFFKYLKNFFVHLPEKTNLLFRLDKKTVLPQWKGLQTTTI